MSNETNEGTAPQSEENAKEEAPRKTPLELVRERQAQLRGNKMVEGKAANERQTAEANSYKRRQHQRRAG